MRFDHAQAQQWELAESAGVLCVRMCQRHVVRACAAPLPGSTRKLDGCASPWPFSCAKRVSGPHSVRAPPSTQLQLCVWRRSFTPLRHPHKLVPMCDCAVHMSVLCACAGSELSPLKRAGRFV
jgi:hypothetical protein